MCVDTSKEPWRCCCGCMSLTQATILIGILYLLETISNAISGMWLGFAFALCMTLLFVLVIVKPYNADVRKLLYYIYLCLLIAQGVAFTIFIIYAFASDWEETTCRTIFEDGDAHSDWNAGDCESWL